MQISKQVVERTVLILCAPILPFALIFFCMLAALVQVDWWWKRRFGPRKEWTLWYAWRPVTVDFGQGPVVWLEWIERQRLPDGSTDYRRPQTP